MKQRRRSGYPRAAWVLLASAALALAVARPAPADPTTDPRVADLVRAGAIRVAVFENPLFSTKDRVTGELRGPSVDLGRELAARIGVPLLLVAYPNPPKIIERVSAGEWDVTFLGVEPERLAVVEFSPPYMEEDSTHLVPAGSRIRSAADADQPGVRIAVPRASRFDLFLTRTLKHATLVRADNAAAAFELLRTGQADAFAASRSSLLVFAAQLPGSRVLEDRFLVGSTSIAVPKGQLGRLAYVSEFIEQAKASGSVQQAITRAGVSGTTRVAPPADPTPGQEVLALFNRFFLAQNARDLEAVSALLSDSPSVLWINNGVAIRGREAVRQQLSGLFQGTWQLTPNLAEFQVTVLTDDVAQLSVPIEVAAGAAGQPVQSTSWLMNQVLVKSAQGWRIASILPIPTAKP